MLKPAIAIEITANQKTGPVSVTNASQASCPKDCPFMGSGCYAESGMQVHTTRRVNKSRAKDAEVIARAEARAIKGLTGERPLRIHVVGDCSTPAAARIVSDAVAEYPKPVWSYTHAWRKVTRKSWGKVSVLASCETPKDVKRATARGYATALVVPEFESNKAYEVDGVKVVPCPAQTHEDIQCVDCRLCWDDSKLRQIGATIAFSAHGSGAKKVKTALVQIGGIA